MKQKPVEECCKGYTETTNGDRCIPVCSEDCRHGTCIAPDVCKCESGYGGPLCNFSEYYLIFLLTITAGHAFRQYPTLLLRVRFVCDATDMNNNVRDKRERGEWNVWDNENITVACNSVIKIARVQERQLRIHNAHNHTSRSSSSSSFNANVLFIALKKLRWIFAKYLHPGIIWKKLMKEIHGDFFANDKNFKRRVHKVVYF